jgi:LmbE family N-acetylglucosaminyl deacetylase
MTRAIVLALSLAAAEALAAAPPSPTPALDVAITSATRLLVLSPHPDDEVLGAGGLIRRVTKAGGAVRVVLLTSGDAFAEGVETIDGIKNPTAVDYRNYGTLREHESIDALATLGVDRSAITFLGFPDDGLCRLAERYLSARAFESPYTDRVSPPPTEQIIRGVRYRGVDVRREIERVVAAFAPTLIVLPHPEDEHPDHCSTHIFGRDAVEALARRGIVPRARVLHMLVHYAQWPLSADAGAGSELLPPEGFPPNEGRWVSLALTDDEAALKRKALLAYPSQMLVIGRFMLAFGRSNELFLEGEPAALPECWCADGVNVASETPPGRYRKRPAHRP